MCRENRNLRLGVRLARLKAKLRGYPNYYGVPGNFASLKPFFGGFPMDPRFRSAIARFGATAKAKLANLAATGEPEDQLRAPLESLVVSLAELCRLPRHAVAAVGESSLSELKTRPDYAITVRNAPVGFIEVKALGKGADPRRFRDRHDKEQWEKLQSLPNLIYTDGNEFSLWRSGQLAGSLVRLTGDIETSGAALDAPLALLSLFEDFLQWKPIPPRDAKQLAEVSARLCRLLREEVTEQLSLGSAALDALATDWRKLLFPDASNAQFADGYAQAITFGMLMARAREIQLSAGLAHVARRLGQTNSLIGTALRLLTDDVANQATLKTSLDTRTRVLDAVHWPTISKGNPDAWLYFYEDFLEVYDNKLRKQMGSYYTPPEVVSAMVRLVHEVLQSRFMLHAGLASPAVTLADPAVGTGTFLLGTLRRIADTVEADEGPGAVPAAIDAAMRRLVAFEIQLGPFAVAQLRIPLTADGETYFTAADVGRTVIWLHTFSARFEDPSHGRPAQPPRLPPSNAPRIPAAGAISQDPAAMPDTIDYDATNRRLLIGRGYVEGVTPRMWSYEVSGKQVLRQWFSYRKANRERPIIGDRRPPSKPGDLQPDHWLPEYTAARAAGWLSYCGQRLCCARWCLRVRAMRESRIGSSPSMPPALRIINGCWRRLAAITWPGWSTSGAWIRQGPTSWKAWGWRWRLGRVGVPCSPCCKGW